MTDRQPLESLYVANLPVIDRVVSAIARREALEPIVAEDFGIWAKARLAEDDYAALAAFRGESSLTTYLHVVMMMLYRHYRRPRGTALV